MHRTAFAVCLLLSASVARADILVDFEDQNLAPTTYKIDAGGGANGFFVSQGAAFNNSYSSSYGGIWSGWAISNLTDTTPPGNPANDYQAPYPYTAMPGSGAGGSATYGIAFTDGSNADPFHPASSLVNLPAGASPLSIDITNTLYDYVSMSQGDGFARKFTSGDYFKLDIEGFSGLNGTGTLINTATFYLANFLNGNSTIVTTWNTVDLSALVGSQSLVFGLQSSDNDATFGMNTPAFFAADNLRLGTVHAPEPSSVVLSLIGLAILLRLRHRH